MRLESRLLTGRFVRLEPLAEAHRHGLRAACEADQEIWETYPYSTSGDHFDPWWQGASQLLCTNEGVGLSFLFRAIVSIADGGLEHDDCRPLDNQRARSERH